MSKFAVVKTGGKQYKVSEGDVLNVELLNGKSGDKVTFDQVLLVADDKATKVGTPLVEGTLVEAVVVDQVRGPKVKGFKFKAKSRYRRRYGHRQNLTRVEIKKIK